MFLSQIIKISREKKSRNLVVEKGVTNNIDEEIQVKVQGNKLPLNGTVDFWYQRYEAKRSARKAPDISNVNIELVVEYD